MMLEKKHIKSNNKKGLCGTFRQNYMSAPFGLLQLEKKHIYVWSRDEYLV